MALDSASCGPLLFEKSGAYHKVYERFLSGLSFSQQSDTFSWTVIGARDCDGYDLSMDDD